jgi:hypothetical protein
MMNGGPIIPNESTKRIGFVNRAAARLYHSMPMDQCMKIVQQLNTAVDASPEVRDKLTRELKSGGAGCR